MGKKQLASDIPRNLHMWWPEHGSVEENWKEQIRTCSYRNNNTKISKSENLENKKEKKNNYTDTSSDKLRKLLLRRLGHGYEVEN